MNFSRHLSNWSWPRKTENGRARAKIHLRAHRNLRFYCLMSAIVTGVWPWRVHWKVDSYITYWLMTPGTYYRADPLRKNRKSEALCHLSDIKNRFSENLPRSQAPSEDQFSRINWRSIDTLATEACFAFQCLSFQLRASLCEKKPCYSRSCFRETSAILWDKFWLFRRSWTASKRWDKMSRQFTWDKRCSEILWKRFSSQSWASYMIQTRHELR